MLPVPRLRAISVSAPVLFLSFSLLMIAGCANQNSGSPESPAPEPRLFHGSVHGGQQPVAGATIQLYAAGAPVSGGDYGAGATALIHGTLPVTDHNGNFSITGDYTLPSTPSYFYIVSTGGSPGYGNPANPDIVLIAALGGCTPSSSLSPSLFININEVTTAAAALEFASGLETQPFIAAPTGVAGAQVLIGGPATNQNDLRTAFGNISTLADSSTGSVPAPAGSRGLLVNTLADVLAYCVNSDPASDNHCTNLFSEATPSGSPVAGDTAQAAWYIAHNLTVHTSALYSLIPAVSPFVAVNSAPASFAVAAPTDLVACFAVLGGSAVTNTATSATMISGGDLGISPTAGAAVTGFTFSSPAGSGVVAGAPATVHLTDAIAANGQGDLTRAFTYAAGLTNTGSMPADISGSTFAPGVYGNVAAVSLSTGALTLDAQGDPDAVFIFQVGSALTIASGTQVVLLNGTRPENIFWEIGSSATIGAPFAGTMMAQASITLEPGITLQGRALASTAAVTLNDNLITVP